MENAMAWVRPLQLSAEGRPPGSPYTHRLAHRLEQQFAYLVRHGGYEMSGIEDGLELLSMDIDGEENSGSFGQHVELVEVASRRHLDGY